jgi:hypothetical protein
VRLHQAHPNPKLAWVAAFAAMTWKVGWRFGW